MTSTELQEVKISWLENRLIDYFISLNIPNPPLQRAMDHLIGTSNRLKEYPIHVQDAGLFHSIYGEDASNMPKNSILERHELRQVIGKRAEELVWIFATTPKPRTKTFEDMPDSDIRTELLSICKANDEDMGSPQ